MNIGLVVSITAVAASVATTAGFVTSYYANQEQRCDNAITQAVISFGEVKPTSAVSESARARLLLVAANRCGADAVDEISDLASFISSSDRCKPDAKGYQPTPKQACEDAKQALDIVKSQ